MSGGVDSSVAAALLAAAAARRPIGVWMRLHDVADTLQRVQEELLLARRRRRCAARLLAARHPVLRPQPRARVRCGRDAAVPRRLSRRSDAEPLRRLQHDREVRRAARAVRATSTARTPSRPATTPASMSSRIATARAGGCSRAATRTRTRATSSTACARTSWPTRASRSGELTKPEVRDVARGLGLATAEKPESQEICFVPGGDYRDALKTRAGWQETPGELRDADGRVGRRRTAAPRRTRSASGPASVSRSASGSTSPTIDAPRNLVTLGRREDLERREFTIERGSFVAGPPPADEFEAQVRIRHRAEPVPGIVRRAVADRAGSCRPLDGLARASRVGTGSGPGLRLLPRRRGHRRRPDRGLTTRCQPLVRA